MAQIQQIGAETEGTASELNVAESPDFGALFLSRFRIPSSVAAFCDF